MIQNFILYQFLQFVIVFRQFVIKVFIQTQISI
jgi:hypothetical protein